MPAIDDQKSLEGLRRMDPEVVSEVHQRYYSEIYRYAAYRLGDSHAAEDIASDVLLALLEAVYAGKGPKNTIRGWIMATASNKINEHYRKQYAKPTDELLDTYPEPDSNPAGKVEQRITNQAVVKAMSKLSPDQQEVIVLRFGSGFSLEDTARKMDKNVNAVKQAQFRALAALKKNLDELIS